MFIYLNELFVYEGVQMKRFTRNPNLFEKILLIIGICVIVFGFGSISTAINVDNTNYWLFTQTVLLWFLLVIMIVLLAVNENMKEELKLISEEQLEQIKILNQGERKELDYERSELEEIKRMKREQYK